MWADFIADLLSALIGSVDDRSSRRVAWGALLLIVLIIAGLFWYAATYLT